MNKQEIKELIIIICGLLVLVASVILISGCQLEPLFENNIEETKEEQVVETTRQINCDSKGNIEYGKTWMTPDDDPNFIYNICFYETSDSYSEWRASLETRYEGLQPAKEIFSINLLTGGLEPHVYFNKIIVLVSELDGTPYGLTEYYFEGGYYNSYYKSYSYRASWTTWSTACILLQLN